VREGERGEGIFLASHLEGIKEMAGIGASQGLGAWPASLPSGLPLTKNRLPMGKGYISPSDAYVSGIVCWHLNSTKFKTHSLGINFLINAGGWM
jgi:hypothetical protein